jgi:FkbM family methyltransferase
MISLRVRRVNPTAIRRRIIHYFNILRVHNDPARVLLARILLKTGLCRMFAIPQIGYRLRFYPSNLSEQLWICPTSRVGPLQFFRDYLKLGDKVIDVGANVGDITLTASRQIGLLGRVWAIEPHPRIFRFLVGNLKLNVAENVQVINAAAGQRHSEVGFTDDRRDDMNRIGQGRLMVTVRPLDELVTYRGKIALLKIDVEGFEKFVLNGAPELLARTQCVHFEISKVHFSWFGYEIDDVLGILQKQGFDVFRIPRNGQLQRIAASYDSDSVENLVAVRDVAEFSQRTGWNICPISP